MRIGHANGYLVIPDSDWVVAVAFSPDGRRIVSGSYDNTIRIWDIEAAQDAFTWK